jgi:hypothetical protein
MKCKISIILSYMMCLYTISSIYYLIRTYFIGTPFKDSLTKQQIKIKQKSINKRRNIFFQGILIGLILIFIWKPFHNC